MNGKELFVQCCQAKGISHEDYFSIGIGEKHTNKGPRQQPRFSYEISIHSEKIENKKSTLIYAIKYYNVPQIYIAWKFPWAENPPRTKQVFSVIRDDAMNEVKNKNFGTCYQGTGFPSGGRKPVWVFRKEGIEEFLEMVSNEIATR